MKPVKCLNGHFYDEDSHKTCPHCGEIKCEYVYRENKILYEDTLVLINECSAEVVEHRRIINVGRDDSCELKLNTDKKGISGIHASFSYEEGMWFLKDNFSKNGTWLNGEQIDPRKKHQLIADDVIELAKSERFVFRSKEKVQDTSKTSKEMDREKARAYLEAGISVFLESGCTDDFALKFILVALTEAPLYIPVKIDLEAMFGETNLAELKKGDIFQPKQNAKMKLCLLKREDGHEIIPMFTSNEEVEKGGGSSVICVYPQDYLPLLLRIDKPVIINPFSERAFCLPQEMIKEFLLPAVLAKVK